MSRRIGRALLWGSSGVTALALMFAITFVAGAALGPRLDAIVNPAVSVPDFSLTDQSGTTVSRQSLRGKIWLAAFFFARCTDNCPRMTARLSKLEQALDPRVQLVSFTMDPQHDTPAALADFARNAHVDGERWHLVTGDRNTIVTVAAAIRPDARGKNPQYLSHSDWLLLIGADGRVRGAYDSSSPTEMVRLKQDVRSLENRKT